MGRRYRSYQNQRNLTGSGIDELLETLLTIANCRLQGESPGAPRHLLGGRPPRGSRRGGQVDCAKRHAAIGDAIVCGTAFGRVKAMYDTLKPSVTHREAGPSMPVNLTGLHVAPSAGEHFYVLDDSR